MEATLKSHKAIINSLDVSPCNKYLASCGNDGCVRIWDLHKRIPIAVFREMLGEKLLILFFYELKTLNNDDRLLLICASEEGNIYVYDSQDWSKKN